MTQLVLLVTLFCSFTAWAAEPDLSQFETRIQEATSRLALTNQQKAQLEPILKDHFDAQMAILDKYGLDAGNRDSGQAPDFQKMRALRNELDANKTTTAKRLSGVLSEKQMAEFEKIQTEQKQRIREKLQSKLIERIGTKLGLTGKQMAQVKPILENHFDAQTAILNKYGLSIGNRDRGTRPGFRTLRALRNDMDEHHAKTTKHLSAILSEEQMAEFEKMQAEQKERMRAYFRSRL